MDAIVDWISAPGAPLVIGFIVSFVFFQISSRIFKRKHGRDPRMVEDSSFTLIFGFLLGLGLWQIAPDLITVEGIDSWVGCFCGSMLVISILANGNGQPFMEEGVGLELIPLDEEE